MKSDLRVVVACLVTVVCLVALFIIVDKHETAIESSPLTQSSDVKEKEGETYYSDYKKPQPRLVCFDPNTADSTTLLGLGLPSWTVRSIYKYRSKGGTFQSPEDFARMHGITAGLYKQIRPYIKISADYLPASQLVGPRTYERENVTNDTLAHTHKIEAGERIQINTADTNALKKVPGIGAYYAKKIVDLRHRYGGFVDLSQLLDIKGFPEDALQYLTIPDGGVKKINVNNATFKQLQMHPYIGYQRAKSILNYRKLKGRIKDVSQLKFVSGFDERQLQLLEPYVEY